MAASHTTAIGSYNNAYVLKSMRLLKLSDIKFVANPQVNIHLQGHGDSEPNRNELVQYFKQA